MNRFVQVPSKGQPMTAQWGADVANGLNAIRSAGQAGMLLTDGPTGTGFAPLPANLRDRRSNAPAPRQFDLRARVESRSNGASNEYRVVVEYYNVCPDAVSFSGYAVSMKPNSGSDDKFGWNVLYESPWSSGLDVSTDYYLNIRITAELDEDKTIARYVAEETFWWISDQAAEHYHQTEGTLAIFTHGYKLGHVIASNSSSKVTQYFDGPLIFLDLKDLGREGGDEGDDGINGTNYPMPFQYKRTDTVDPETGEVIESSYWIANNTFYWDGVLNQLEDFAAPATGTVYLCCTQKAPSTSGEAEWEFSLATSPEAAPSGGRVCNFKLYDFEDNRITMDYRTTFLELKSPHETACLVVKQNSDSTPELKLSALDSAAAEAILTPSNKSGYVKLRSDGRAAYLLAKITEARYAQIFENGSNAGATFWHDSKKIDFRTSDLKKGNTMGIHVLTIKDVEGNIVKELNVLSTADITIVQAKGKVLKDIKLEYNSGYLEMTKTTVDLETGEETVGDVTTVFTTEMHSAQS